MNGMLVVTPDEMKRLEKTAFDAGESEQKYMENAGLGIANVIESYLVTPSSEIPITLLIGKGNNGGDAFVAGEILLKKGFDVVAYHLYPLDGCSPLCKKMGEKFRKSKGKVVLVESLPSFEKGIIVDGIFGTGFKGELKGICAELIEQANRSELPIFAIDIPSGLNGENGKVNPIAIKAHTTIFLGLPKIGFFLEEGWNHVGKLVHVDFGMPQKFLEEANGVASLFSEKKGAKGLPKLIRNRHKYQAGYIIAFAGSSGMPGAAVLSCLAALKAGAGIIRLFYPQEMKEELAMAPYELIKEGWDLKDDTRIFEEAKRAKAFLIGPGIGRESKTKLALKQVLSKIKIPTVLDADALYFLAQDPGIKLPENAILTPHHQEMERILGKKPTFKACQEFVKEKHVTVVLKGAPTVIFHPHTDPLIIPRGNPGMATAGTGDVLTGIIAGLIAQGLTLRDGAALGVFLHALSGEIAAKEESSYSILATSLINYLPKAILALQKEEKR